MSPQDSSSPFPAPCGSPQGVLSCSPGRLGIFGGTFNPIHCGHLRAAEECREALRLDEVLFIPAGNPPLKSAGLASAHDRLRMASLAVEGNPRFRVLPIEAARPGKSFTIDTLMELGSAYPAAQLHFIIGIEAFLELHLWKDAGALFRLARFVIIRRPPARFDSLAASRYLIPSGDLKERLRMMDMEGPEGGLEMHEPELAIEGQGVTLLRTTPIGISATMLRARRVLGLSLRYLLPEAVESFIITSGLYTDESQA